jgi:hypothetical protein
MSDTGAAKLPGLPALKNSDPALQRWAQAVAEHLEVRAGARGNPAERGVTQRELLAATKGLDYLRSDKSTTINAGDVVLSLGGGMTVTVAIDAFAKSIFDSPLYKNLMKRLDDQSRFDDVPEQVRKILLMDIAEEAARRGADIVRLDKKIQTSTQSLAYTIEEVTAAIAGVSAGVRETTYASAIANLATAGKVTQVQARLDNFAGGGPGLATIEQKMSVIASNVTGLSAEYTLKVQAGGIFGGTGLSAHLPADPTKPGYSMFLIAVDKFGLVFPGNVGGADVKRIPFGIDANGIYMNSDVYIKGTMRVDAGGSTLRDGLRGSLNIGISGSSWSDALARNAIYSALGRGPSAPDNGHLVIGDCITITSGASSVTKYWNGGGWSVPGVVVSGDMIVDGGLSASKIDTRGLTIKDAAGNIILGAGVGLGVSYIYGLGQLATKNSVTSGEVSGLGSLATKNSVTSSEVTGLGALATQSTVKLGHNVTFPDGSVINSNDLVSKLSKINSGNIANFMDGAAITNAYIGNAEVGTLKIAGNAVTVPMFAGWSGNSTNGGVAATSTWQYLEANSSIILIGSLDARSPGTGFNLAVELWVSNNSTGAQTLTNRAMNSATNANSVTCSGFFSAPSAGYYQTYLKTYVDLSGYVVGASLSSFGAKR